MPGAIRYTKLLTSFNKTEEMHKKTKEAKGKLESRQAQLRTLVSPVDTAHGPVFPAWVS